MPIIPQDISEMLFLRLKNASQTDKIATHASFSDLSSVFETIIAYLLDGEMRVFASSYSRVVYACRSHNIPAEKERKALVFRVKQSDFPQNAGNKTEYLQALSTLVHFIQYLSQQTADNDILDLIKEIPEYEFGHFKSLKSKVNISGVVSYISEENEENGNKYFHLTIIPNEIGGEKTDLPEQINIVFREKFEQNAGLRNDFFRFRNLLKPFNSVNITELFHRKEDDIFEVSYSTQVVLEPDYLVDVTDIAGCFTSFGANPLLFLLSKLTPSKDSEAMLKGTLINALLDASLKNNKQEFEDIFRLSLKENILKSVCYGGVAVKRIWDSVLSEHSENIKLFAESVAGQRVTVEPSFISPLYGIQGRLDVLTEDRNDPLRKDIYELKSGKAPYGNTLWLANSMQVACYNMLLESTYGEDRRGTSAVLYSSAKTAALRNFLSSVNDKIRICTLRNEIIKLVYSIAEGDFSVLKSINLDEIGGFPSFEKQKIDDFSHFYKRLDKMEGAYYQVFVSFYLREMITAKTGALCSVEREGNISYATLWHGNDEEKEKNFSILPHLTFEYYDEGERVIYLKMSRLVEHTFRNSDVVVLYPFVNGNADVAHNQVIKGVLKSIIGNDILFSPRGQVDEEYLKKYALWTLEHDMMEKNYWTAVSALYDFLNKKSIAKDVVFTKIKHSENDFEYHENKKYTKNQNEAICKALKANDFFLLQGPPGTGKTSVALMGIVKNILEKTSQNIVLLAFTNRAVEEIASKLRKEKLDFLKIGHQNIDENDASITNISEGKKINEIKDILQTKRVLLSTVSAFSTRAEDLNKILNFDNVIIDEASQLTEIQVVGILHYFKRFILIGDQLQLPAVVAQSEKYCEVKNDILREIGLTDTRTSLFERLYAWCLRNGYTEHCAILDTHFRMHSQIADLVNVYYNGALKCGSKRQFEVSEKPRLIFYSSDYQATYKKHEGEAKLVYSLLSEIKKDYGDSFSADTVGVITPWRAQIATIKNEISDDEILEKVTIDTVERFQGGEKDIIIASMAVYNTRQMSMIQSFDSEGRVDRKLNVLLSRAREKIILLAYEPVLQANTQYAYVIKQMTKMQ